MKKILFLFIGIIISFGIFAQNNDVKEKTSFVKADVQIEKYQEKNTINIFDNYESKPEMKYSKNNINFDKTDVKSYSNMQIEDDENIGLDNCFKLENKDIQSPKLEKNNSSVIGVKKTYIEKSSTIN